MTIFEVVYILKHVIYPNVFQMALNVSRVFDNNPDLVLQNKLRGAMSKLRGALLICELATNNDTKHSQMTEFYQQPTREQMEQDTELQTNP